MKIIFRISLLLTLSVVLISCSKKEDQTNQSNVDKKTPTAQTSSGSEQGENFESGKIDWLTDVEAAKKSARENDKYMIINFTGSDWCRYCIKLEEDIFSKPPFVEFANSQLVMLYIDFPDKKILPQQQLQQNHRLVQQFNVSGYPELVILSPDFKEISRFGFYPNFNVERYISFIQDVINKHQQQRN